MEAEKINPYNDDAPKGEQVEQMFDAISGSYDAMNGIMSVGLHRRWRNTALKTAARDFSDSKPTRILDVATGTGDVAFELHHMFPEAEIRGIDLSEGMLKVARDKLEKCDESAKKHITFERGDSLAIDAPDDTYDLITVAYGVRNFEHLEAGYREMYRVLRPGGVLCVIELSMPEQKLTRAAYKLYSRFLVTAVGTMVSGDNRAYAYLPESIEACPQRREMALLMRKAGFRHCRWRSLTFGAVTFYLATKK